MDLNTNYVLYITQSRQSDDDFYQSTAYKLQPHF
jgi:hypothetical protein